MNKVQMTKYKLKDVAIIYDGPHATPKRTEQGPIYLGIDAITEDCKLNPQEYTFLSEQDYKIWTKRVIPQYKDIVFSYEATLGRYAIIPEGFIGCLGRRLGIVRITSNKIFHSWLYYYFQSPEWKAYIANRIVKGSTVNRISVEDMPEYVIQAPPLPVQHKIAAVLTALDDKIALNKRINDKLEAMAKRLYDYWFVQFDFPDENGRPYKSSGGKMVWNETLKREIPAGWEVKRIEEILDEFPSTKRYNTSEYLTEGQFPIIDQDSSAFIAGYTNDDSGLLKRFPAVLFRDHSTCVKFLNFEYCRGADGTQILYSNDHRINQYYLYLTIKEMNIPNPGYSRHFKYLKELPIIIPDLSLSNRYERIVKSFYKKKTNCDYEIVRLTSLRDRLLPLLINGQVVVEGKF